MKSGSLPSMDSTSFPVALMTKIVGQSTFVIFVALAFGKAPIFTNFLSNDPKVSKYTLAGSILIF